MTVDTPLGPMHDLYEDGRHVWRIQLREPLCEVVVAGGEEGPDPDRVEWAARAVPRLDALLPEAVEYVESFASWRGRWSMMSAEFGRTPPFLDADHFDLLITLDHDTYGVWGVRFRHDPRHDRFLPFQFSRRQW